MSKDIKNHDEEDLITLLSDSEKLQAVDARGGGRVSGASWKFAGVSSHDPQERDCRAGPPRAA